MEHLALALCLSLLYVGYELARAATIALFSGGSAGWSGVFAACGGFLLTFATLELYGRSVELLGPSLTLMLTSSACSAVLVLSAAGLSILPEGGVTWWSLVASLYAFRETYVTLIGTQIWALLSGTLKGMGKKSSRRWICIIQGVSCILSAFAGLGAGRMAAAGGQVFLLLATAVSLGAISLVVGLFCGTYASQSNAQWDKCYGSAETKAGKVTLKSHGEFWKVLRSSASLFRRSPLLAALLAEAVVCQVLTATVNLSFNEAVRDSSRSTASLQRVARAAGFVGRSSALVGLLSGVLQLVVMPWAMVRIDPAVLLGTVPLLAGVGFSVALVSPGFQTVTAAYTVTKILDYSIRGTALELVYQPMPDYERLLGKEAIATVGVRMGRTAAHVVLYLISVGLGGAPPQRVLMGLALTSAALWALALRRVETFTNERGSKSGAKQSPSANGKHNGDRWHAQRDGMRRRRGVVGEGTRECMDMVVGANGSAPVTRNGRKQL